MKNSDFFKPVIAYQTPDSGEFNKRMEKFKLSGYRLQDICLCKEDGNYKLLAFLETEKEMCKCLLSEKKIPEKDRVYPSCYTRPRACEFHAEGYCACCMDDEYCLYQDTEANRKIIEQMVLKYKEYQEQSTTDDNSMYYQDTELGRIFSVMYEHLNNMGKDLPRRKWGR